MRIDQNWVITCLSAGISEGFVAGSKHTLKCKDTPDTKEDCVRLPESHCDKPQARVSIQGEHKLINFIDYSWDKKRTQTCQKTVVLEN